MLFFKTAKKGTTGGQVKLAIDTIDKSDPEPPLLQINKGKKKEKKKKKKKKKKGGLSLVPYVRRFWSLVFWAKKCLVIMTDIHHVRGTLIIRRMLRYRGTALVCVFRLKRFWNDGAP